MEYEGSLSYSQDPYAPIMSQTNAVHALPTRSTVSFTKKNNQDQIEFREILLPFSSVQNLFVIPSADYKRK